MTDKATWLGKIQKPLVWVGGALLVNFLVLDVAMKGGFYWSATSALSAGDMRGDRPAARTMRSGEEEHLRVWRDVFWLAPELDANQSVARSDVEQVSVDDLLVALVVDVRSRERIASDAGLGPGLAWLPELSAPTEGPDGEIPEAWWNELNSRPELRRLKAGMLTSDAGWLAWRSVTKSQEELSRWLLSSPELRQTFQPLVFEIHDRYRNLWSVQMLRILSGWIPWLTFLAGVLGAGILLVRRWIRMPTELHEKNKGPLATVLDMVKHAGRISRSCCSRSAGAATDAAVGWWGGRWLGRVSQVLGVSSKSENVGPLVRTSLDRLGRKGSTAVEITGLLSTEVQSAYERLDRDYVLLNYLIWCIPSLGFLGTVTGISLAMLGSDGLLNAEGKEAQVSAIQDVSLQLSYAFDTTWLALVISIGLMFAMRLVRRHEDEVVAAVESSVQSVVAHVMYLDRLAAADSVGEE
jgi:biopolymer transport protein ExbB/TolQ